MNGRWVAGVLLAILLIVGAVGLGVYVYNIGIAQGLATSGRLPGAPEGGAPYPYYGPFFYRPFGWGFGFLGCLVPLFFFFLIFSFLRFAFWGGRWGWHRHYWGREGQVPPPFEEWHRKAHETQTK